MWSLAPGVFSLFTLIVLESLKAHFINVLFLYTLTLFLTPIFLFGVVLHLILLVKCKRVKCQLKCLFCSVLEGMGAFVLPDIFNNSCCSQLDTTLSDCKSLGKTNSDLVD